ncbi:MAG: glutamate racemase, partial [Holophagales bacterium]|nr:glutamate racemase [Holophagales bacterium]
MSSSRLPFTVGIFDSGVGGLSVLRAVRALRSDVNICFVADQAHVPYGPRPLEQVGEFAMGITNYLLEKGADLIVVACNAASAAALHSLRENFPQITFVGMEPAVKPAVNLSNSGTVGVLATPATFQGKLYASVIERFASNIKVMTSTCTGLVQRIEIGDLDGLLTRSILEEALNPMLKAGADSIVLGCTHYPFVIPLIKSIVGPNVEIIDPSPAVARQIDKLLNEKMPNTKIAPLLGCVQFCTTGSPAKLSELLSVLINEPHPVHALKWESNKLIHALIDT